MLNWKPRFEFWYCSWDELSSVQYAHFEFGEGIILRVRPLEYQLFHVKVWLFIIEMMGIRKGFIVLVLRIDTDVNRRVMSIAEQFYALETLNMSMQ